MTRRELISWGTKQLEQSCIDNAKGDAWTLFEFVTNISKLDYLVAGEVEVSKEEKEKYEQLIQKRMSHIPLQHITNVQAFMGFDFFVNEHVLIPRQDTETLIEEVLEHKKNAHTVLDLCTGSGCIAISLALLGQYEEVYAIDLSEKALEVAEKNKLDLIKQEKVEMVDHVHMLRSNLFEAVPKTKKFDLIVSNPPYIKTAVCETLMEEVRVHEPRMALDGMEDGLYFYREIIKEAREYLSEDSWLFFEIGHDQGEEVKELFSQYKEYEKIQVKKDLAGLDRIVFAHFNRK